MSAAIWEGVVRQIAILPDKIVFEALLSGQILFPRTKLYS